MLWAGVGGFWLGVGALLMLEILYYNGFMYVPKRTLPYKHLSIDPQRAFRKIIEKLEMKTIHSIVLIRNLGQGSALKVS